MKAPVDRLMSTPSLQSLQDERIAWRSRTLSAVIVFFIAVAILAGMAPVKKVAHALGQIRAAEEIVSVEHSVGGDVAEVYAKADQEIAAGAPILRLKDAGLEAEIAALEIRQAHYKLRQARLESLLAQRGLEPPPDPRLTAFDRDNAARLLEAERADLRSELFTLEARLAERRADRAALAAARRSALAEVAAHQEQVNLSKQLGDLGLSTRRTELEGAARVAAARTRLAELEGRSAVAQKAIEQIEAEMRQAKTRRRAQWSAALTEALEEQSRAATSLSEAYERRAALLVAAPISGRILEMGSQAPGDVIGPGELIARIAPPTAGGEGDLIAEVRISPDDIGHINYEARAVIEVTTFKSDVFGEIEGALISISPTSVLDEQGAPMFRARYTLDRIEASVGESRLRLAPGMIVSARLVTDERSLFDYLADPITSALRVAFSE